MALKCPDFHGIPLVSHVGSTMYFSVRVMRQFGSLQTIPEDRAHTRFEHTRREDQTSVDCQSDIPQVLSAWRTAVMELPYFPDHPIQDERDFQVLEEYILRFYRWSSSAHEDFTGSPQLEGSTLYAASSTSSRAVQAELTSLRTERDNLCREIAEKDEQLIDQRQLQRELAQAHAELQRRDQELARSNVALERSRKKARGVTTHFYTTGKSCQLSRVGHLRPSPFLHGKASYGPRADPPSKARLTNTNFFLTGSVTV
ncbi:hypothetical protein CRG98_015677 [Punica granatum]|uniref:Uncharacterized protein n=1 Tax=Punica granatum TaxID=22663 RepID=A0A2I0K866_PUNGR|nr:hypothetical protein CRG98_015677 [Punica granatum]